MAQIEAVLLFWVAIPLLVTGCGLLLDRLLGLPSFEAAWLRWIAAAAASVGLGFILLAMKALGREGRGTPSPAAPPLRLVWRGVYALCRHPMFFGYDLIALAWGLAAGSPGITAAALLFIALQLPFLSREEKRLERRFGIEYRKYKESTPMLVPFIMIHRRKTQC